MRTYQHSGLQRFDMLQELLHPFWPNATRCLSPCSVIPRASSMITHWTHPINYHHLLFQCSDTSSFIHTPWVKHIQLCISIQCFTAATCFQCVFIHPWSNILSSLLSTLQRGGSATSFSTPGKIASPAYHLLLFTAVTTSSASLSNTPGVYHHPALPSCDTNCCIIQTGKIHPVLY